MTTRLPIYGCVLAVSLWGSTTSAQADELTSGRCTNAALRGSYGFTAQGTTVSAPLPPPLLGPFTSSGVAVYDGRGHVTLTASSSFNGVIDIGAPVSGSYAVAADCSFTSELSNGATFRGVIVEGGAQLLILQTTPGTVITGVAQAASAHDSDNDNVEGPRACSVRTVRGAYGFLAEGAAGPPTIPAALKGPLAGVGTVTLNPSGTFLLNAQRSVNGVLDPQVLPLTGTYHLDADCSIRMIFDVGFHFAGTVVRGGDQILFLETDPGTSIVVKARRM